MHHLGMPTLCQGLNKTAEGIVKIECEAQHHLTGVIPDWIPDQKKR